MFIKAAHKKNKKKKKKKKIKKLQKFGARARCARASAVTRRRSRAARMCLHTTHLDWGARASARTPMRPALVPTRLRGSDHFGLGGARLRRLFTKQTPSRHLAPLSSAPLMNIHKGNHKI